MVLGFGKKTAKDGHQYTHPVTPQVEREISDDEEPITFATPIVAQEQRQQELEDYAQEQLDDFQNEMRNLIDLVGNEEIKITTDESIPDEDKAIMLFQMLENYKTQMGPQWESQMERKINHFMNKSKQLRTKTLVELKPQEGNSSVGMVDKKDVSKIAKQYGWKAKQGKAATVLEETANSTEVPSANNSDIADDIYGISQMIVEGYNEE